MSEDAPPYNAAQQVEAYVDYFIKWRTTGCSNFGRKVLRLLIELYRGQHHIPQGRKHYDFTSETCIQIVHYGELATIDSDELLRLALLASKYKMRVAVSGRTHGYLQIQFTSDGFCGNILTLDALAKKASEI